MTYEEFKTKEVKEKDTINIDGVCWDVQGASESSVYLTNSNNCITIYRGSKCVNGK